MGLKRHFLLIALCFVPTSLFSNQLYFPQVCFGAGGSTTTTVVLMNYGATTVWSNFQIYVNTGGLLRSIPTTVAAGGSTRLNISDIRQLTVCSWGMIDAGMQKMQGVATIDFRIGAGGTLVNRAAIFGVEAVDNFSFPVDVSESGNSNTGFAMANVSVTNMTVLLELISESGTEFAREYIKLGPGQQFAELVTTIWPELAKGFKGTLLVLFSGGQRNSLVVTAVNVKEGFISAVRVLSGNENNCAGCFDF